MLCNALSEFMLLAIMLLERWRKRKVFIFFAAASWRKKRKIPKSHFYSFMIIFYVVLIILHTLKNIKKILMLFFSFLFY